MEIPNFRDQLLKLLLVKKILKRKHLKRFKEEIQSFLDGDRLEYSKLCSSDIIKESLLGSAVDFL